MNPISKDEYKMGFFSAHFHGTIIGFARPQFMRLTKIGEFDFYPLRYHSTSLIRAIFSWFIIPKALYLFYVRNVRFDVIISPNPLATAIAAYLIGRLTKAKIVVEINGNFESAFKFGAKGRIKPSFPDRMKDKVAQRMLRFSIFRADMVKLVYSRQLAPLNIPNARKLRTTSFPNFVPIRHFLEAPKSDEKYILLMGYPWYLKGVDILIKAFNLISPDFEEYRLKIVGWNPEGKTYYENLKSGNSSIELLDPVYYDGVINYMTNCSLYVLASRTDSSPRVLREAMASQKPIIASNIDGVPELIKDGYNGLLFEKENVQDLAQKIRLVLSNKGLSERLARNGCDYVQQFLSEECYIERYVALVNDLFVKEQHA
jgi:glycosyltransferase involved in cell wall biosynthesis